MKSHTASFTYLRSKLQEWKSNDLLPPTADVSWQCFQQVATTHVLPLLHQAKEVLESEGLEVSISDIDEGARSLGFYVADLGLFFAPSEDGQTCRFVARRLEGQVQGYEAHILYRNVKTERVKRLIEESLLRLLGPRRVNAANQ